MRPLVTAERENMRRIMSRCQLALRHESTPRPILTLSACNTNTWELKHALCLSVSQNQKGEPTWKVKRRHLKMGPYFSACSVQTLCMSRLPSRCSSPSTELHSGPGTSFRALDLLYTW